MLDNTGPVAELAERHPINSRSRNARRAVRAWAEERGLDPLAIITEVRRITAIRAERERVRLSPGPRASIIEALRLRLERKREQAAERADAEAMAALRRAVFAHLRRMGFRRIRAARGSASVYYRHDEARLTVRVSDHDVPVNDQRIRAIDFGQGHTWAESRLSLTLSTAPGGRFAAGRWLCEVREILELI